MNRKFLAHLGDRRRGALPWVTFADDWLTKAADLDGVTSSDRMTIAGRIRLGAHSGVRTIIMADDAAADLTLRLNVGATGRLEFACVKAGFTVGTNGLLTCSDVLPVGEVVDYVLSFRNAVGLQSLRTWVNGAPQVFAETFLGAGAIDLPAQASAWRIGADFTGTPADRFAGDMAFLWAAFGTTAAAYITSPGQVVPGALGANGEGVTGTIPAVFFAGLAPVWNGGGNLGNGGAFVMSGGVVNAA